jgi:hypothetical protein
MIAHGRDDPAPLPRPSQLNLNPLKPFVTLQKFPQLRAVYCHDALVNPGSVTEPDIMDLNDMKLESHS